jgi:bacterioferritin
VPAGSFTTNSTDGNDPKNDPKEATAVLSEVLERVLRHNLAAERVVLPTYQEIICWLGNDDPATRTLLEDILADEEEHADIAGLLGA